MKISQKNKNVLLVISSLVLAFIAWKMAIVKTIALNNEIFDIKKEISNLPNRNQQNQLVYEIQAMDSILFLSQKETIQSSVLKSINTITTNKKIEIIEFHEPLNYTTENDLSTSFYILKLRGDYIQLEQAIFQLENTVLAGAVNNLNLEKVTDYATGKKHLECQLILSFARKDSVSLK